MRDQIREKCALDDYAAFSDVLKKLAKSSKGLDSVKFEEFLKEMGVHISDRDTEALFKKMDKKGDKRVDAAEFEAFMNLVIYFMNFNLFSLCTCTHLLILMEYI